MLIVGRVTPEAASAEEDTAEQAEGTPGATEEEEPTPERTPTPQRPTATPTPQKGEICLKAFLDENRNGLHDPDEPLKPAVAFTISSGDAVFSNYVTTGADEPYCITGLDPGSYKITRSVAPNEVLTTNGDWSVSLAAGTSQQFDFGSYEEAVAMTGSETGTDSSAAASAAPDTDTAEPEGGITRILVIAAVIVAVLLLVGVLVVVLSARRAV